MKKTPIRRALVSSSTLQANIQNGIGAVKNSDRSYLAEDIRADFSDSLDLEAALRADHEQENHWDYLLGHTVNDTIIALEPHPARQGQIPTVINKKASAAKRLKRHMKQGKRVTRWLWVTGKNHFADTEKARRLLDQNGIKFVGTRVTAKDLR